MLGHLLLTALASFQITVLGITACRSCAQVLREMDREDSGLELLTRVVLANGSPPDADLYPQKRRLAIDKAPRPAKEFSGGAIGRGEGRGVAC